MMGEILGFPAHMSSLTRIKAASFSLEDCLTFSQIETMVAEGTLENYLRPIESALSYLPKLVINDKLANRVKNGAVLPIPAELAELTDSVVMQTEAGLAIAIYQPHPQKAGVMKPEKVLRNEF